MFAACFIIVVVIDSVGVIIIIIIVIVIIIVISRVALEELDNIVELNKCKNYVIQDYFIFHIIIITGSMYVCLFIAYGIFIYIPGNKFSTALSVEYFNIFNILKIEFVLGKYLLK